MGFILHIDYIRHIGYILLIGYILPIYTIGYILYMHIIFNHYKGSASLSAFLTYFYKHKVQHLHLLSTYNTQR